VATGQGFIGNNMFAYCLNNPICYVDKDGKAADSYGGMAGNAFGMFLYELFTGDTHPDRQAQQIENQVIEKQNEMLKTAGKTLWDAGKALWDAYMRSYNMQQNANMQNAQLTLDGLENIYDNIEETDVVSVGKSGYHSVQAANEFKQAFAYFALPIPTAADEALALGHTAKGLYHLVKSLWEVFSWD